jgi:tetratricopeptide (TPR) repeat protein
VLHRVAKFASRVSIDPGTAPAEPPASASDVRSDLRAIADSVPADEARSLVRHWFGSGRLHAMLPPSRNPEVTAPVSWLVEACHAFCDAVLMQHPALADDKADGLCLAAAIVTALGDRDTALTIFKEAFAEVGLGETARSTVLAQRASVLARSSPSEAEADIAQVLHSGVATDGARAQALWLRARISMRRGNAAAAVADLGAALQLRAVEPALRALCLQDRATCQQKASHLAEAINDLDELLRMRDLPPAISGPARLDRAVLRGQLGEVDGEVGDYGAAIDLEGVPDETRLKAHMNRGLAYLERGNRRAAIDDFVTVRDDPASPDDARRAATAKLDDLDPFK